MNTDTNIKQGYKQTSLGILPQEWEVVRLGEVFQVSSGATPLRQNKLFWENPTIQWVKIGDLNNSFIISTEEKISLLALKKTTCKLLPKNTLLIAMYGGFNQIGRTGILSIEATTNQAISALIPKNNKISPIFVNACLLLNKEKWKEFAISSRKDPNITKTDIEKFQIPLPPLTEQEKIAQILSVWDKGISVLKSLIEAKTKRKKALMQRLLTPPCESPTPSLRASETSAAIYNKSVDCHDLTASNLAMTEKNSKAEQSLRFAEFTDKWQEMRLGDICEIYQPQTIPQSDFTKEGYNVYGANGIIGKYHSYNHEKEQIAIACRGNSCGAVNFTNPKSWITGNAMVINLDNSKNADKIFVYYVLLNSNLNYLVTGSGQPQITSNIKKHSIKLPTLAEQKKIAQVLSACDKEIELLKSKFQCLKTQKKGLMQRLLNGEVRVKY